MVQPGDIIGRYQVQERIGTGAHGVVHVAEHIDLGRRVALKVLRQTEVSPVAVTRFFDEAKALARLGHAHIVSVYDYGVSPSGDSYYVMELLEGETLRTRLKRPEPMALWDAVRIAAQTADALQVAHEAGVIHRDVKPDNIFLVPRPGGPFVKVLDFGVARTLRSEKERLTITGTIVGTPLYMAPEQSTGKREAVDHRADIYALGILLHEMVSGAPPFMGANAAQIVLQHISAPLPSLRETRPETPERLECVLERACEKSREARYPTMAGFRDALREILDRYLAPGI
jgi:serine/threonine-protein kinase